MLTWRCGERVAAQLRPLVVTVIPTLPCAGEPQVVNQGMHAKNTLLNLPFNWVVVPKAVFLPSCSL